MGIPKERLTNNSIDSASFPSNTFDFITFGAVLEHLYDPSGSIEKAIQWLKPGGIIHIEVPSSEWLIGKIANLYYKISFSDYVTNTSPMHSPYHLYEFSLKSFQEHASRAGYEIALYEYYVCNTFMPGFIDTMLRRYMRHTNTGMQLCVWLRKK